MSQSNYKHTYQEFLDFCKAAEEYNNEIFDEARLVEEPDGSTQYIGTYRDTYNYKHSFHVTFNEGMGSIAYVAGPDECMTELDAIYMEMFRSQLFTDMTVPEDQIAYVPVTTSGTVTIQDTSVLIQIMEAIKLNISKVLTGDDSPEELLKQSQRLLFQVIDFLAGIRTTGEASRDDSDNRRERFNVSQGRKILKRDDISGRDHDFASDESALFALGNSSLIVFGDPFDCNQCKEIETDLQNGEAIIVQQNLVEAYGYNTLIRTSEGCYCLISLGGTI
ncbi:hypothetical protein EHV15_35620 [Paenibacillus oralis]|uniref:Uncharacterized protein n=1 Tax=Paenibacillus oralis TaxID=2490856 RepID=A0A3P3TEQ7_9BACL|nr:hypothetical protein [Paenibacillus oralis]RRJ54903.1 hypothetical protein EHV15_35620 [Paenibacillus oralis]